MFASRTTNTHPTFIAGALCKSATLRVDELIGLHILTDSIKNGNGSIGSTVIVTPKHDTVVGIRAYNCDCLTGIQWQQWSSFAISRAVVLKKHDTLASCLQTLCLMISTSYDRCRNIIVWCLFIHLAKFEASLEQTEYRLVDTVFGDESLTHSLWQFDIRTTTLKVSTAPYSLCICMDRIRLSHVSTWGVKVIDSPAVACDKSVKAPVVAQNLCEQTT